MTVSVIIPVLDRATDPHLSRCLASVRECDYPQDQIQIIIKGGMPAEQAKGHALKEATGDFVLFLDSDNVLLPDYLRLATDALNVHPNALGVEATYWPTENGLNTFLTTHLHISDPVSKLVATEPLESYVNGNYDKCWLRNSSYAYPIGANGFLYRRKDLLTVEAACDFEDTQIPLRLMRAGFLYWIRMYGSGIQHFYVDNLWQFLQKRRRQTFHYLKKKEEGRNTIDWTMLNPAMPKWVALLYCLTIIGPVHTALKNLRETFLWLYWPPLCLCSAIGILWGVATYYCGKVFTISEVSLQPKRAT